LNPETENRILPVLLTNPEMMNTGDLYRHIMAGGAGYGAPFEREPDLVLKDVKDEKISLVKARTEYGVAIEPESMEVDSKATQALRKRT
jgi:N-methylhydantoinase B